MYNDQVKIFNGNKEAENIDIKIQKYLETSKLDKDLSIILINPNSVSIKYVEIKKKIGDKLGIPIKIHAYDTSQLSNIEIITRCADIIYSESNKSVILQLPLPLPRFYSLLTKIPLEKDVDMLSEGFRRRFYKGNFEKLPPIVRSLKHFIDSSDIKLPNMRVLVAGHGELVGKPISYWLKENGSEVTVTEDYASVDKSQFETVILCTGVAGISKGEDLPDGCNVIDFGYSILDGKIVGDFQNNSKTDHLGVISMSPGGMGPLVVRYLFLNHLGL